MVSEVAQPSRLSGIGCRVARMVKLCQVRKSRSRNPSFFHTFRQKTVKKRAQWRTGPRFAVYGIPVSTVEHTVGPLEDCTHTYTYILVLSHIYIYYLIRDRCHFSDLVNLFVECILDRSGVRGSGHQGL